MAVTDSAHPAASSIESSVSSIATRGVNIPHADHLPARGNHPVWTTLRAQGTDLWLDTGDLEEADRLWSAEFSALTTNNTLLSKEVGKGIYDELIREAVAELRRAAPAIGDDELVKEIGLLLNAHHGLRLVERFGCRVSVELHTDLAHDQAGSLAAARRLHAICPSHFIVKVPLTPTGILVARALVAEEIPVNFTLEFSARQNFVVASVANPDYVNVFLGRLNSFVADHGLGDGRMIGEKATLSSQRELLRLRQAGGKTRQIAASMRESGQIETLAGVDVFTMPTAVAQGMPNLELDATTLSSQVNNDPSIDLSEGAARSTVDALWTVPETLKDSVAALIREDLNHYSGDDFASFMRSRGHQDLFPAFSDADVQNIAADGKIPSYPRWREAFEAGEVGLDAVFNVAGHASFAIDQQALDDRIRSML